MLATARPLRGCDVPLALAPGCRRPLPFHGHASPAPTGVRLSRRHHLAAGIVSGRHEALAPEAGPEGLAGAPVGAQAAAPKETGGTWATRRVLTASAAAAAALNAAGVARADGAAAAAAAAVRRDEKLGYEVAIPNGWEVVDKAGATLLTRDPDAKGNTLGVVVSPSRVGSLEAFGTLDDVGDKLVGAETKKESTISCELVSKNVRQGASTGASIYDFEYRLDSTRGKKYVLSTVSISRNQLYILNVNLKGEPDDARVNSMRAAVARFDLL